MRARATPFNGFFVAFMNVAYTRFRADKDIMDTLVHLGGNMGTGRRGQATAAVGGDPLQYLSSFALS